MATVLYKDGERTSCEAHALQRHLDAGYTLTPAKPRKRPGRPPKAVEVEPEEVATDANPEG